MRGQSANALVQTLSKIATGLKKQELIISSSRPVRIFESGTPIFHLCGNLLPVLFKVFAGHDTTEHNMTIQDMALSCLAST